jgi:hypothetical protein
MSVCMVYVDSRASCISPSGLVTSPAKTDALSFTYMSWKRGKERQSGSARLDLA